MEAVPESCAGRRPNRFVSAALVVAALVCSFVLASVVTPATPARGAVEGVTLRIFPASAELGTEDTLDVTVSITNGTDAPLEPGDVDVYLNRSVLDSRENVTEWLAPDSADSRPGIRIARVATPLIAPGTTATVTAEPVPADSLGLGTYSSAFGPRGLAGRLLIEGTEYATGRGTVVWSPSSSYSPTNVAVLVPLTVPPTADGLIDAEALAAFTEPAGTLTLQLGTILARPNIAVGLDPRIPASIRVLGSDAPPSAVAWLERLASASNEIFPLAYADADLALQSQSGAPGLLAPITLDHEVDPARFETPPAEVEENIGDDDAVGQDDTENPLSSGTGAESTPSPETTEGPESTGETGTPADLAPSTEDLLAWSYTRSGIGWPAANTVISPDLAAFAASGITTTVLDEANVDLPSSATPGPLAEVGDMSVLVADTDLSALLNAAVSASSDVEVQDTVSRIAAVLATITREQPGNTHSVVATLDRGWAAGPRVAEVLATVSALGWANTAPLAIAMAADPVTATLVDSPVVEERRAAAAALLATETAVAAFSTILERPELLTGELRLQMLALLSVGWRDALPGWTDAVAATQADAAEILGSVRISESSTLQIVGDNVELPVRVENDLDQPVTVTVTGRSLNSRAEIEGSATVTVPPDATGLARLPARSVSNGGSTIAITMFSSDTPPLVQIGETRLVDAEIRAGWENVAIVILGLAVALLFGFGLVRSVRNRRRQDRESGGNTDG
ncbi:DUF6049 family protein [Planctomonas psychrotolerans]|uniref:DUF6049 family protein n=1 Tax=Planctomonas psychrotolerans TaxID=2528712 RepID=UPI00123AA971|nr:DUF6049 family protein [Planctomonas psychrotolerans]